MANLANSPPGRAVHSRTRRSTSKPKRSVQTTSNPPVSSGTTHWSARSGRSGSSGMQLAAGRGRVKMNARVFTVVMALCLIAPFLSAEAKVWALAFGTMKTSDGVWVRGPGYGAAWNFDTFEEAQKAALAECQKQNPTCEVFHWHTIQRCFAVGYRVNYWPYGVQPYGFVQASTMDKLDGKIEQVTREASSLGPWKPVLKKCVGLVR